MRRTFIAIAVVATMSGACKTTEPAATREPPTDGQPQRSPGAESDSPGPFEVAVSWADAPTGDDAVTELVGSWSEPAVERMHRTDGGFSALLLSEASEDAVLLRLAQTDAGWAVVGASVVATDYLWPTR